MSATVVASSGLINWSLLVKILFISAGLSVGLVVLFTLAVNSLSVVRRDGATTAARAVNGVVVAATSAAIVVTLIWGLYFIVHK